MADDHEDGPVRVHLLGRAEEAHAVVGDEVRQVILGGRAGGHTGSCPRARCAPATVPGVVGAAASGTGSPCPRGHDGLRGGQVTRQQAKRTGVERRYARQRKRRRGEGGRAEIAACHSFTIDVNIITA